MASYHVRKDGTIGRCTAKEGKCPLKGAQHFPNEQDAQNYVDQKNSQNGVGFEPTQEVTGYYHKISYIKEVKKPFKGKGATKHFSEDRQERHEVILNLFGEGKVVDTFEINDGRRKNQIQQIRDTGTIYVYDKDSQECVTVLEPRGYRVRDIYAKAGKDMPEGLYENASENEAFLVKHDIGQQSTSNNKNLNQAYKEKGVDKYKKKTTKKNSKEIIGITDKTPKKKKKKTIPKPKKISANRMFDKLDNYNNGKVKKFNFD